MDDHNAQIMVAGHHRRQSEPKGPQYATDKATQDLTYTIAPSPFLVLPQEVRNLLYEQIIGEPHVLLKRESRWKGATNQYLRLPRTLSSIALANHRIHCEILDLAHHAWPLYTTVTDYEYAHLIMVLHQLSGTELTALASRRSFSLQVKLDIVFYSNSCTGLVRWPRYLERHRVRDHQIDVHYCTVAETGSQYCGRWWDAHHAIVKRIKLERLDEALKDCGSSRIAREEAEKIRLAILGPRPELE